MCLLDGAHITPRKSVGCQNSFTGTRYVGGSLACPEQQSGSPPPPRHLPKYAFQHCIHGTQMCTHGRKEFLNPLP